MRKNFFKKKLASTLALAMVVTSLALPTSASAATVTKIVKQGGAAAPTVLYVGDKGTDYGLSKVVKGNKYAWTTSNSKIATINKSGVVTAKAPGVVTVKVTARDSKGKWLKAFTQKLTVNQRATSIDIGADDFTLVMGQEKDLNAVKTPAKSTDAVRYYSDNTAVATVNVTTGVVKTVGVGEATITVYSKATTKSANTSKYNKKDTVKVTVADGIQSVKQTTPTKFDLTFATDQSAKLTAADLTVTDADGVKQIIKSLGFSADGKTVTVTLYVDLSDAVTYKVAYGTTDKTFVASKGDVASIVLEGKTVQYAKPTEIGVKLLDKNGVDVTTSTLLNYVTFDVDNSEAYIGLNGSNKYEIQVYNFPKSVAVTATYHTYKYTDGVEATFKASAVFNSVEEIKATANDIAYTFAPSTEGPNWDAVKTSVPATAEQYKLYIKAVDADSSSDLDETDFGFESTDTSIITVSDDGLVYPVKAGSAYIKVTYGATSKMIPVTVGAESKVVSVAPENNVYNVQLNALTGTTFVDASKSITLVAKDQYGDTVAAGSDSIETPELLKSDVTSAGTPAISAIVSLTGDTVTFAWDGIHAITNDNDGTYTYRLTYKGKPVIVTVKVAQVSGTVSYINFDTQSTTLDAVLKANATHDTDKVLTVYGYNSAGQQVQKLTTGLTWDITLDGDTYSGSAVTTAGGTATVTALDFNSGTIATQAAVGTYKIKATDSVSGKSATTTVVVKNTQVNPTVKLDDSTISATDERNILDAIQAAYVVKLGSTTLNIVDAEVVAGNVKVTTALGATPTVSGKNLLVKKIIVAQPVEVLNTTVYVNRTITISGNGNIKITD